MQAYDKSLKDHVDIVETECLTFDCYWPRQIPGKFIPELELRYYDGHGNKEWICGNRNLRGCPQDRLRQSLTHTG